MLWIVFSELFDYSIHRMAPRCCPTAGSDHELIVVCGKIKRDDVKLVMRDANDRDKKPLEFCPGDV